MPVSGAGNRLCNGIELTFLGRCRGACPHAQGESTEIAAEDSRPYTSRRRRHAGQRARGKNGDVIVTNSFPATLDRACSGLF